MNRNARVARAVRRHRRGERQPQRGPGVLRARALAHARARAGDRERRARSRSRPARRGLGRASGRHLQKRFWRLHPSVDGCQVAKCASGPPHQVPFSCASSAPTSQKLTSSTTIPFESKRLKVAPSTWIELPNSKLRISLSTLYYRFWPKDVTEIWPDVSIPPRWADLKIGRDAPLDYVTKQLRDHSAAGT